MSDDQVLHRWRLVLGDAGAACAGADGLPPQAAAMDQALEWLYGGDTDAEGRDLRRSPVAAAFADGPAPVTAVDWLDQVATLFPRETIERLQRDAVDRSRIDDVVTDPALLDRIEPSPALLRAVLRTRHLMNPQVLDAARRLVDTVVPPLVRRLAPQVRQAFTGVASHGSSRCRTAGTFDIRRTVRDNLGTWQPRSRRLAIEQPRFTARLRGHLERRQVILLVDQSGSMAGSVIWSAVTAACLCRLPGVRTHLVAFDTEVVDLTSEVDDPVELLLRVQLGGGTDIARAVGYGGQLIEEPRRATVVLISDLADATAPGPLARLVRTMVEQGTTVLALAALDEDAAPAFDREVARRLAAAGARVGAMTPGELAGFLAGQVGP